jgi:hypothetical protein
MADPPYGGGGTLGAAPDGLFAFGGAAVGSAASRVYGLRSGRAVARLRPYQFELIRIAPTNPTASSNATTTI